MSQALTYTTVTCPYCHSRFEVEVDVTAGSQAYYEDCQVCCHPIYLDIQIDADGEINDVKIQPGNS